jgi:hypothetical protein
MMKRSRGCSLKTKVDYLVCVAGWEERFAAGLRVDMDRYRPIAILMIVFSEFSSQTETSRAQVESYAAANGITCRELIVHREPQEVWQKLRSEFGNVSWRNKNVALDISTMPREVMWWSLSFLAAAECKLSYIYHRPLTYSDDWLTRDTARPRLVYQHSGIAKLGKPTALLLLNGFDTERAEQMIQFFEPRVLLLGLQKGSQFRNEERNIQGGEKLRQIMRNLSIFEMDAYSEDHGFRAIVEKVKPILPDYNLIAASLGPKTSAIAMFRVATMFPEIALAYAPSRQFNTGYSSGIGDSIEGTIEPPISSTAD